MQLRNITVILCLFIFLGIKIGFGATVTWNGGGGDFNTGSNWNTGYVPGTGDDVIINTSSGSPGDFITLSADVTVNSLHVIAASGSGSRILTFGVNGNVLTVNTFTYFESESDEEIVIDAGGSPGGFVFNGDVVFDYNDVSYGSIDVIADATSQGFMRFNGSDVTINNEVQTFPGDEPTWEFDGSGTTTVIFNGTTHFKPAAFTFGISNSPGVDFVNYQSNEDYFTVYDGNVTVNNSSDVDLDDLNLDSWTGGGDFNVNDNGVLRLGSDSDFPGGYASESVSSTSTLVYYGSSQIVSNLAAPGYGHLQLEGSGTKSSGGSFDIRGDFTSNVTWNDGNDTHTFDGVSNQTISGSVPPTFYNMVVNKSIGKLYIAVNTDVDNILTMTNGPIDLSGITNGNELTLNNPASGAIDWTSGSGAYLISEKSDVTAKLKWAIGTNTDTHIIPFGNIAGDEIPVHVTVESGDVGTVDAATYSTSADDNLPYPPGVTHVNNNGTDNSANTINRFWQLEKTSGGTVTVRYYYADTDIPSGGESDVQPQRWSGSDWEAHANSCPGGTSNDVAGNFGEGQGIVNFSPWTLASLSSPLPVELTYFNGTCSDDEMMLNWATASELNNSYFEILRSREGEAYNVISKVDGQGNSSVHNEYAIEDKNPTGNIMYYKLKQVDYNGEEKIYGPISVQNCSTEEVVPYIGDDYLFLRTSLKSSQNLNVSLIDASGRIVYRDDIPFQEGSSNKILKSNLGTGLYIIRVTKENGSEEVFKLVNN